MNWKNLLRNIFHAKLYIMLHKNEFVFFLLQKQFDIASEFIQNEMGQMVNRASRDKIPINLTKEEIQLYIKRFQIIDKDRKGYVSINDIRRGLKVK